MYTELNVPIIRVVCPDTMTKANCPVYQYLRKRSKVFHVSINETHLIPNSYKGLKIVHEINKMRKICENCGKKVNERTR